MPNMVLEAKLNDGGFLNTMSDVAVLLAMGIGVLGLVISVTGVYDLLLTHVTGSSAGSTVSSWIDTGIFTCCIRVFGCFGKTGS